MAIKTEEQRKVRMMDGKPIGEFFDAAAQRQKRDNQFATYDGSAAKQAGSAEVKSAAVAVRKPPASEGSESDSQERKETKPDAEPKNITYSSGKISLVDTLGTARASARASARRRPSIAATSAPSKPASRAIDSYTSNPSILDMPRNEADKKRVHAERIAAVDKVASEKKAADDKVKDRARRMATVPYNPYKPRSSFS